MKGIYLASFTAYHPNYDLVYQDINGKRDIGGDMMEIDLTPYDFIIATPPCNYYSRANYRRETSKYAQLTKHLLPDIIHKLIKLGKPFIVENVRNSRIFNELHLFDVPCRIYIIGRHTYWTNIEFRHDDIDQRQDFLMHGYVIKYDDTNNKSWSSLQNLSRNQRQGGYNVYQVIERFLETIHSKERR